MSRFSFSMSDLESLNSVVTDTDVLSILTRNNMNTLVYLTDQLTQVFQMPASAFDHARIWKQLTARNCHTEHIKLYISSATSPLTRLHALLPIILAKKALGEHTIKDVSNLLQELITFLCLAYGLFCASILGLRTIWSRNLPGSSAAFMDEIIEALRPNEASYQLAGWIATLFMCNELPCYAAFVKKLCLISYQPANSTILKIFSSIQHRHDWGDFMLHSNLPDDKRTIDLLGHVLSQSEPSQLELLEAVLRGCCRELSTKILLQSFSIHTPRCDRLIDLLSAFADTLVAKPTSLGSLQVASEFVNWMTERRLFSLMKLFLDYSIVPAIMNKKFPETKLCLLAVTLGKSIFLEQSDPRLLDCLLNSCFTRPVQSTDGEQVEAFLRLLFFSPENPDDNTWLEFTAKILQWLRPELLCNHHGCLQLVSEQLSPVLTAAARKFDPVRAIMVAWRTGPDSGLQDDPIERLSVFRAISRMLNSPESDLLCEVNRVAKSDFDVSRAHEYRRVEVPIVALVVACQWKVTQLLETGHWLLAFLADHLDAELCSEHADLFTHCLAALCAFPSKATRDAVCAECIGVLVGFGAQFDVHGIGALVRMAVRLVSCTLLVACCKQPESPLSSRLLQWSWIRREQLSLGPCTFLTSSILGQNDVRLKFAIPSSRLNLPPEEAQPWRNSFLLSTWLCIKSWREAADATFLQVPLNSGSCLLLKFFGKRKTVSCVLHPSGSARTHEAFPIDREMIPFDRWFHLVVRIQPSNSTELNVHFFLNGLQIALEQFRWREEGIHPSREFVVAPCPGIDMGNLVVWEDILFEDSLAFKLALLGPDFEGQPLLADSAKSKAQLLITDKSKFYHRCLLDSLLSQVKKSDWSAVLALFRTGSLNFVSLQQTNARIKMNRLLVFCVKRLDRIEYFDREEGRCYHRFLGRFRDDLQISRGGHHSQTTKGRVIEVTASLGTKLIHDYIHRSHAILRPFGGINALLYGTAEVICSKQGRGETSTDLLLATFNLLYSSPSYYLKFFRPVLSCDGLERPGKRDLCEPFEMGDCLRRKVMPWGMVLLVRLLKHDAFQSDDRLVKGIIDLVFTKSEPALFHDPLLARLFLIYASPDLCLPLIRALFSACKANDCPMAQQQNLQVTLTWKIMQAAINGFRENFVERFDKAIFDLSVFDRMLELFESTPGGRNSLIEHSVEMHRFLHESIIINDKEMFTAIAHREFNGLSSNLNHERLIQVLHSHLANTTVSEKNWNPALTSSLKRRKSTVCLSPMEEGDSCAAFDNSELVELNTDLNSSRMSKAEVEAINRFTRGVFEATEPRLDEEPFEEDEQYFENNPIFEDPDSDIADDLSLPNDHVSFTNETPKAELSLQLTTFSSEHEKICWFKAGWSRSRKFVHLWIESLVKVWWHFVYQSDESEPLIEQIMPPSWLIYAMVDHPNVKIREAGLVAYHLERRLGRNDHQTNALIFNCLLSTERVPQDSMYDDDTQASSLCSKEMAETAYKLYRGLREYPETWHFTDFSIPLACQTLLFVDLVTFIVRDLKKWLKSPEDELDDPSNPCCACASGLAQMLALFEALLGAIDCGLLTMIPVWTRMLETAHDLLGEQWQSHMFLLDRTLDNFYRLMGRITALMVNLDKFEFIQQLLGRIISMPVGIELASANSPTQKTETQAANETFPIRRLIAFRILQSIMQKERDNKLTFEQWTWSLKTVVNLFLFTDNTEMSFKWLYQSSPESDFNRKCETALDAFAYQSRVSRSEYVLSVGAAYDPGKIQLQLEYWIITYLLEATQKVIAQNESPSRRRDLLLVNLSRLLISLTFLTYRSGGVTSLQAMQGDITSSCLFYFLRQLSDLNFLPELLSKQPSSAAFALHGFLASISFCAHEVEQAEDSKLATFVSEIESLLDSLNEFNRRIKSDFDFGKFILLLRQNEIKYRAEWVIQLQQFGEASMNELLQECRPNSVSWQRLLDTNGGVSVQKIIWNARQTTIESQNRWYGAQSERHIILDCLSHIAWTQMVRKLGHQSGLFDHEPSRPLGHQLDPIEGPHRQRRRLQACHFRVADKYIQPSAHNKLLANRERHPLADLVVTPNALHDIPSNVTLEHMTCRALSCIPDLSSQCLPMLRLEDYHLACTDNFNCSWPVKLIDASVPNTIIVEGDLVLSLSWLKFAPSAKSPYYFAHALTLCPAESIIQRSEPSRYSNSLAMLWPLAAIAHLEERRFELCECAIEIFPVLHYNLPIRMFVFEERQARANFITSLQERRAVENHRRVNLDAPLMPVGKLPVCETDMVMADHVWHRPCLLVEPPNPIHRQAGSQLIFRKRQSRQVEAPSPMAELETSMWLKRQLVCAQVLWLRGSLTNFQYLVQLNSCAGRTYNDLMQYPIFPWVLSDYVSNQLILSGESQTFRDLRKPIAVQSSRREEVIRAHYLEAQSMIASQADDTETVDSGFSGRKLENRVLPAYHYPSNCSNEAITLHYLFRLSPFTVRLIRFQDYDYDVPERTFQSISTAWHLATESSGVKEMIPDLFVTPLMLKNNESLALKPRQNQRLIHDVELPPWSKRDPRLFVSINRAALETPATSSSLPHWINLIFGYMQTGQRAKEALNLYHPFTYYGAIDLNDIEDPVRRSAVLAMIRNYGQTPRQLFPAYPHLYQEFTKSSGLAMWSSRFSADTNALPPVDSVKGFSWGNWLGSPDLNLREHLRCMRYDIGHGPLRLQLALWTSTSVQHTGAHVKFILEKSTLTDLIEHYEDVYYRDNTHSQVAWIPTAPASGVSVHAWEWELLASHSTLQVSWITSVAKNQPLVANLALNSGQSITIKAGDLPEVPMLAPFDCSSVTTVEVVRNCSGCPSSWMLGPLKMRDGPFSGGSVTVFFGLADGSVYSTFVHDAELVPSKLSKIDVRDWSDPWADWSSLYGHAGHAVTVISISSQYRLLATADASGTVLVWDLFRRSLLYHLPAELASLAHVPTEISPSSTPDNNSDLFVFDQQDIEIGAALAVTFSPSTAVHLALHAASGQIICSRLLDFQAEVPSEESEKEDDEDAEEEMNCLGRISYLPMTFSCIPEGLGVDGIVLGGPSGRLIWLSSLTLDTLDQEEPSSITSLNFVPATDRLDRFHPIADLCRDLVACDENGCLYHISSHDSDLDMLRHIQSRPSL